MTPPSQIVGTCAYDRTDLTTRRATSLSSLGDWWPDPHRIVQTLPLELQMKSTGAGRSGRSRARAASAHEWYPEECCGDMDYALVKSILRLAATGGGAHRNWWSRRSMAGQIIGKDFTAHVCTK